MQLVPCLLHLKIHIYFNRNSTHANLIIIAHLSIVLFQRAFRL